MMAAGNDSLGGIMHERPAAPSPAAPSPAPLARDGRTLAVLLDTLAHDTRALATVALATVALTTVALAPRAAALTPPLILAIGGESANGFDPIQGWGRYGNPLFHATLLAFDPDLKVIGDLATDWTLSEDRLTWTLTLRDDARFSDGVPLTADDVVFTFHAARDAGGVADLSAVREARALGTHAVAIDLHEPRITFTADLIGLGIVPRHAYGPGYARNPIGAGPYVLIEWREGEQLIVAPNPYWHGGATPFPRITFVFGDEAVGSALARSGAAHLIAIPPVDAQRPPAGMRLLSVATVDNRGVMFPIEPEGGVTADGRPIGNAVTSDRAIRVAINELLDRDALVALAVDGRGTPAFGPADGLPWDEPAARLLGGDVEAARRTLDAAGWQIGRNGIRNRNGLEARFALIYPANDPVRQALALGVARQAAAVGIAIEPLARGWADIERSMHANAVLFGWGAHDPSEMYALHHGDAAGVGWFNPGYYRNPIVDAHLNAAQRAESFAASLPHWRAAQFDGETGFGARGDAAWAWLVNVAHDYWVADCLDLGPSQIHPHGHGFPITHAMPRWQWTCD
jgi:peptide/nickel transport system substrate-binding protein